MPLSRKALLPFCLAIGCQLTGHTQTLNSRLTDPAAQIFFEPSAFKPRFKSKIIPVATAIIVKDDEPAQSIDGFGFALTGGSALHIMHMQPAARASLLNELFGTGKQSIGTSYLRLSIGASDLDEAVFSYDDLPPGETDTLLEHFDLGYDRKYLVPLLKEILRVAPQIQLMASPWSPPVWMKTNHDTRGGNLLKTYYPAYAKYFVKYIQAMQKEGIRIAAITVQNEPLHPGNNPSLQLFATDEAEFVRDHLGPAFQRAGIQTKIIIYDHNADKPEYPISILNDAGAKKYIDGSAFHLYGGKIEALSEVHAAHPDRNLYFTEQWVGAPGNFARDIPDHIRKLIIGASRNWSKTVIEWNLAADANSLPHTDRGGCTSCLGAVTITGDEVKRNPAYYIIAHAAKFVRPGAIRIGSTITEALPNVAFRNTDGSLVLIVLNNSTTEQNFSIVYHQKQVVQKLSPGATATYTWQAPFKGNKFQR